MKYLKHLMYKSITVCKTVICEVYQFSAVGKKKCESMTTNLCEQKKCNAGQDFA
jgi:hypothetical protein